MVNIDKAFELRYKYSGEEFQVLVDFNKLEEFKKTPDLISVYDVLADNKIFKDQKKGELASENLLIKIFPNKSNDDILKIILLKGECQIPTAYLNKLREEKKKQVINYIVNSAINAQTKGKFTALMIELEINKLKYNFDFRINFENQAEDIVKLLKKVMPISMEKIILQISIPGEFCGAFYGPFRKYGKITKEYFDKDGYLKLHIEISETQIDDIAAYIKKNSNGMGEYHVSKK